MVIDLLSLKSILIIHEVVFEQGIKQLKENRQLR